MTTATLKPIVTSASADLAQGITQWHIYGRLGWLEMKRRYRRTVLGPFWGTFSVMLFVGAMGTIGVELWNRDARSYVPFLAAGLIVWILIQTIVNESCALFISSQTLFRQMRMNYSVLAYALVWRNLIVFAHNIGVYLLGLAIFVPENFGLAMLLVIPGVMMVAVNAVWIALLLGMVCLRFRDLQQLTANLIQIGIFVTPVFWPPDVLKGSRRIVFVAFNPLYHMIEIIRLPLTNQVPSVSNYVALAAMSAVGWTVTMIVFGRYRRRIAYWA